MDRRVVEVRPAYSVGVTFPRPWKPTACLTQVKLMGRDLLIVPEKGDAEHAGEIQVPGHVCLKESDMVNVKII